MNPEDSSTIEKLLSRQEHLGSEIENVVKNHKKASQERKTKSYFERRIKQLQELAKEFNDNDDWLQDLEVGFKTSEYFTKNYYILIRNLTDQYTDEFNRALKDISTPKEPLKRTTNSPNPTGDEVPIINLIRRQNVMKSSLQRLLKANVPQDAAISSFKAKEKLWEEIQDLHFKIWQSCEDPTTLGYDMETYVDLEEKMLQEMTTVASIKYSTSTSAMPLSSIPLPKINIPKFGGEYGQWPTFADLFEKVVHNQQISAVEKMWYLKTNLTGEAERHLALTDNNYATAWSILKDRFDNKRILTSTLIQNILDLQNISANVSAIKAFHDVIQENLAALSNMNINVTNWDPLLLQFLVKKLDRHTHGLYESSIVNPRELQTMESFLKFLEQRFQALESIGNKEKTHDVSKNKATSSVATSNLCKLCNAKAHPLYSCEKFRNTMTPPERLNWVQKQHLCVNCLKSDHKSKECKARSCPKCSKKHNSLLHLERQTDIQQQRMATSTSATASVAASSVAGLPPAVVTAASNKPKTQNYVLLATAKVKIVANNGQTCEARAILDSGSQVNLVTQRLINKLSITTTKSQLSIEGIGLKSGNSRSRVNIRLEASNRKFSTRFEAFILPQIISPQPSCDLYTNHWKIPKNIKLADPEFFKSQAIDILIGAEFYHDLLLPDQMKIGNDRPLLQNTMLGWIVIGKTEIESATTATCAIFPEEDEKLSDILERFWKIDDFDERRKVMTKAEISCETHFVNTICRNEQGRFIVCLPFSDDPSTLGESRCHAEKRLESLERRLTKQPSLKREYIKFMDEYKALGHMEEIQEVDIPKINYFIPHHCVLKPESTTTKVRVVFDASAKTSSGLSLNDILQKGPTVQSELVSILLRFRTHRFVFTADIEKMYRQILVNDDDTAQQLIVWRKNDTERFQYYRLKTITYGTTSAPYLATKCLQHLASQNITKYPYGASAIRDDFYVDDCLSGADTITTCKEMQRQITIALHEAGFKLRKWCANHSQLLAGIPQEDKEINLDLDESSNQTIKTLGLIWLPKSDQLCGRAHIPHIKTITKRSVASDIARIFDPLGIFGPVTVKAKVFMQQLWEHKMSWDEELPQPLSQQWTQFRNELASLNDLSANRHIFNGNVPVSIQIHTFVDASEMAYGAAVYIRATHKDNTVTNRLLFAKSKVAPMKRLTIPRLELCAAVIGAEITNKVRVDLKYTNIPTFFWSDSEIVLSWIQSASSNLHTFVANRVSQIQRTTQTSQWYHVSSFDNPADILSRGINPEKLAANSMWFYGPVFLYNSNQWWLKPQPAVSEVPNDIERKIKGVIAISVQHTNLETIICRIDHRNDFRFLQHTVCYLLRPFLRPKPQLLSVTPKEIRSALLVIVRTVQISEFEQEIKDIKRHKAVSSSSTLSSLAPFIDADEILRVGGRLEASILPYDAKHPMLLPYNNPIVKLLFKLKHEENGHCGPQTLLSIVRQTFWPVKGKIMARNIIHSCIRCSKAKPKLFGQVMGNLPADRVIQARPFLKTGVDYCGPFWIHYKVRGKKPTKAYLAVFCCFATKAIHLELVSDLTTNGFIGALIRFTSRRGRCQVLYSDNATNFVGAKNQMEELKVIIHSDKAKDLIMRHSSNQGIEFKFIPPRSPHFGGLWEAAVKSAKHLLIRSVSTASLTYEELETVIIQIEAILNSRPLTPMSTDPNDLSAITPGHFLIGEPLNALPDPNTRLEQMSLVTRWQLVSHLKHEFWKRWTKEYLNELKHRNKWKTESKNLKEGDMVIVKDDNLPVMKWPIGRVHKVYKGEDGLVRVADIKTSNGVCKRALHLLAPLPTENTLQTLMANTPINPSQNSAEMTSFKHRRLESNTPNKRRKTSASTMLITVVLTLLMLPIILATPITHHQFPNKPGLYFEGIGSINRIVGEWKIITYFDLSPIQIEMQIFRNGTTMLQNLCPMLQQQAMCLQLVKHFNDINIELRSEAKLTKIRRARGALNIVGNIANKLFGVLDSEYAENISTMINEINNNEITLSRMIQNQTSVIDSMLNIISNETEAIAMKINYLQQEINSISKDIGEVQQELKFVEIYTTTAIQLSLMADKLQKIEAAIFDVLTDSRHGRISPLLISPDQLQQEILKIKGHLPNSLHLPFQLDDTVHIYSLMSSQSGVSSHHVLFEIKLPLTDNDEFDLFNIIPIPATINKTMLTIQPDTTLFAVTPHRDQYFALTSDNLHACMSIKQGSSQLLCSDKLPRLHQGAQLYSCELNMLKGKTDKTCVLTESKSDVIWRPLLHTNQWIFGSKYPTYITSVCNGTTENLELQGSSLLSLQDDCKLKHQTATIQTYQIYTDTRYESHITFDEVTSANSSETRMVLTGSPFDLNNELNQLKQLHKTLNNDKIINLPTLVAKQNIHHYVTSYAALFLVVSTIVWLLWKMMKPKLAKKNSHDAKPVPASRFSVDADLA